MKQKSDRLDTIKMIISSQEVGLQDDLIQALKKEGFNVTQATLSRDLKQLKVAKAATPEGGYVYVLPNDVMYPRRNSKQTASDMLMENGFVSLSVSGNIAVIHTRPGYASSMAYDIDNRQHPNILGTIAGEDTIFMVVKENMSKGDILEILGNIFPNIYQK